MKVKIQQQQLKAGIDIVKPFSGDNATQQVFNNILLNAATGFLTLGATNGEYIAAVKLECEVSGEGGVTVPAKLLADSISNMRNDSISLNGNESQLNIKQGNARPQLRGIPKEEFITLPEFGEGEIKLNLEYFQQVLGQVLFAAATDMSRPVFCGVNFKVQDGILNLTTADGFRSSHYFMDCNAPDVNCTIPVKPLQEIVKLKTIEDFGLTILENKVLFYGNNFLLSSTTIEGNYPDIKQLEPTSFNTVVKIDRERLLKTLKLANVYSVYDANYVLLEFADNQVSISTRQTDIGDFGDKMDCAIQGSEVFGWYNCSYLISMLQACPDSEVEIKLNDDKNPAVIKDGNLTLIIMPMTGVK